MQVGSSIGRFQVLRELGRGGMGAVFAARDPRSGREVAIKVLIGIEPEQRLRFIEEARALTRVRDPGLVGLFEADLAGEMPYLVMELVHGETLHAHLERGGPLEMAEAIRIVLDLACTLQRLHAAGVIHRDLKPGNVILAPGGRPVLLDLGLVLILDRSARLTRSGEIMGTPGYMPPEQVLGRVGEMGPASDVYGLGGVLYALLTGRAPFTGPSALSVLEAIVTRAPAPPSATRPGHDTHLDRVVLACLAKDPRERPLLADLQAELRCATHVSPRARRGRLLPWAAAVALLSSAGAWLARPTLETDPRREVAGSQATRSGPEAAACVSRGDEHRNRGDLLSSRDEYDRAIALDPGLAQAWFRRGSLRQDQGDLTGAHADYDRALELDPSLAKALANRGNLRMSQADFPGALSDYDRAIQLEPGAAVFNNRGALRRELGQLAGARDDLDHAIELDPDLAMAWLNRGHLRQQTGDHDGARSDYDRALSLDKHIATSQLTRGQRLLEQGNLPEARRCIELALQVDPGNAQAWIERGRLRARQRDAAGAIEDHGRAIALAPHLGWILCERGDLRRKQGDQKGALQDYERAIEVDPGCARAWGERGFMRHLLGEVEGARSDYDRALGLKPPFPRSYADRGYLREKQGDFSGACDDYDQAIELEPSDAMAHLRRGGVRLRLGDQAGACRDYLRAIELDPRVAVADPPGCAAAHLHRGRQRQREGDVSGAVVDLARFLELDPGNQEASAVREELVRLKTGLKVR